MPASVIFRKGTPIMNIWYTAIPEAMTPSPHWKNVPPASAKKNLLLVSELLEDHPDLTDEPERLDFSAQSPEEMLATLQQAITADFPSLPDCNVTVKYINAAMEDYLSPAFYLTSPLDQLTENTIYINQKNGYEGIRLFTTLAP